MNENINSTYDPVCIYDSAHTFQLAAERCEEYRPTALGDYEMLLCPAVVNYALACEEYLKCLLQIESRLPELAGHKLSYLFTLLPKDIQKEIRNQLNYTGFTA